MPLPTLDGSPVFGSACSVRTSPAPRASSVTPTFGEDGLPTLDGGGRGGTSTIRGTLRGFGPSGLATAEGQVRAFNDGNLHMFGDSLGTVWPSVRLVWFSPIGRVRQSGYGYFERDFTAILFHQSA
jgi:hypothetical protein